MHISVVTQLEPPAKFSSPSKYELTSMVPQRGSAAVMATELIWSPEKSALRKLKRTIETGTS